MFPNGSQGFEQHVSGQAGAGEPSMSGAIERLFAATQGVITKRIDLALLQVEEIFSRGLASIAVIGLSVLCLTASWFATVVCAVLLIASNGSLIERVALFGLINLVAAALSLFLSGWIRPHIFPGSHSERRIENLVALTKSPH